MPQPNINFDHLERLTDDTGLIEHCLGRIPRRKEGYSTDDNARALWLCIEWIELLQDEPSELKRLYGMLDRYLAFLLWAQRDDGWFHNNFYYDRTPESETRSEDCLGRSVWAVTMAYLKLNDNARRYVAAEILRNALSACRKLRFARSQAWVLASCSKLLMEKKNSISSLGIAEDELKQLAETCEHNLLTAYKEHRTEDWHWFEKQMTYANGILPWGLFLSYRYNRRNETLRIAKESLDFLIEKMGGFNSSPIRPIGNRGWCSRHNRADWDQQPIDVMKLALAANEAYHILDDSAYLQVVLRCRDWFYGGNDHHIPLVDPSDGSCCDGLNSDGPNQNRGAESTLSYLMTEALAHPLKLEVFEKI
ncbi:glycosyl transferase [Aeribacillus sp. FSL K6-8394]|uniref:glycosyl transferase n=1 Tax=Aeribacillus sp. FSL K6-8394 TaxID=2954570 RepID=UPI0030F96F33